MSTRRVPYDRLAVVIPAHNEEHTLGRCLTALDLACRAVPETVDVEVLLVLDRCTDATRGVAEQVPVNGTPVRTLELGTGNVGIARKRGAAALLRPATAATTWLATTDADSQVPPHWLTVQLAAAGAGWDAFAGTIAVSDWSEHPPQVCRRFLSHYRPSPGHAHVHGANLGISASVYRRVGGFPPVQNAEDVALLTAVSRAGGHILRAENAAVLTSARIGNRAPAGFAQHLQRLY